MSDDLSDYEKKRLETMAANAEVFRLMGLDDAVKNCKANKPAAPKAKRQKKEKPAAPTNRRAMRSRGLAPDEWFVEDDLPPPEEEDEGKCSAAFLKSLVERQLEHPWTASLTEEQRQRLHAATDESTGWFHPFLTFTANFGGKGEGPLSEQNMKDVARQVMKLVSGGGVTYNHRDGVFCENRPITLGVTADQITQLRAEAQIWIPRTRHTHAHATHARRTLSLRPLTQNRVFYPLAEKRAPADVIGLVVNGATVTKLPPPGPRDTSNGWILNHPLKKVQQYCEHLDEVRREGLDATMSRLMGEAEWAAKKRAAAVEVAEEAEEEAAAIAAVDGEVPFTMEMVREAVDIIGSEEETREEFISYLEENFDLPKGICARHGYVLEVMIGAVVAEAEAAKERGEGSSAAGAAPSNHSPEAVAMP